VRKRKRKSGGKPLFKKWAGWRAGSPWFFRRNKMENAFMDTAVLNITPGNRVAVSVKVF
jgi:hypothetical protein